MTLPTLIPARYPSAASGPLLCKADRNGRLDSEYNITTVTTAATTATNIGLRPFRQGAVFSYGASTIYIPDWDTSTNVTVNVGYVYVDNVTYTNDVDAFASALTTGQTAGFVTFDENAGMSWRAQGDGWIVLNIQAGTVTTQVNVESQISLAYDQ